MNLLQVFRDFIGRISFSKTLSGRVAHTTKLVISLTTRLKDNGSSATSSELASLAHACEELTITIDQTLEGLL